MVSDIPVGDVSSDHLEGGIGLWIQRNQVLHVAFLNEHLRWVGAGGGSGTPLWGILLSVIVAVALVAGAGYGFYQFRLRNAMHQVRRCCCASPPLIKCVPCHIPTHVSNSAWLATY